MSKWKITDEPTPFTLGRVLVGVATAGVSEVLLARDTYRVENTETGETREVDASSRHELGEKINRGEFVKR